MTLFPHQVSGADWLRVRARGYLADKPRLGKTRTLLAAVSPVEPLLVVCPAIVRTHWLREAALMGFPEPTVLSYQTVVARFNAGVGLPPTHTLILDEAHYLKTPTAQRTKLLLGKGQIGRRAPRVYAASGTPISKNPFDIWTVLSSLFPEVALAHGLRTADEFKARFCEISKRKIKVRGRLIDIEKIEPSVKNEAEFADILGAIMLRREVEGLPPVWWQTLEIDGDALSLMPEEQDALESGSNTVAAKTARQQVGLAKMGAVAQMLLEQYSDSDEKVVVFAYHRAVLNHLRDALAPLGVCYIDGDTSPARRDQQMEWFQTLPGKRVFLGQIDACQTGVDLSAASQVVIVEPSWTADVNIQAAARVAGPNQTQPTCIAQMIALAGTVDERIVAQHKREAEMAAAVLG